jgi:hypothetical protein
LSQLAGDSFQGSESVLLHGAYWFWAEELGTQKNQLVNSQKQELAHHNF